MKLKSFHNKAEIKKKYVDRVKDHYKNDEIIKGTYWENGKGCAVGCTIEGRDHERYEKELGLPEWLAHLEDYIFEGLPNGEAKEFPLKFLKSIKVGSDLSLVKPKFLLFVLKNLPDDYKKYSECKKAVEEVIRLLTLESKGKKVGRYDWESVESAAWAAESVESAAWAAALSAARSAALSAALSAAWAAALSAESAAESAAWAARSAESAWSKMAKELIRLLGKAK